MASLGENLRTFLLDDLSIYDLVAGRVHQNHMPQESAFPAIWFARQAEDRIGAYDGDAGVGRTDFALECLSTSIDTAGTLSKAVFDRLNFYRGDFADTTVQGVFVTDQDDNYQLRNDLSDFGVEISALRVSIWTT